MAAITNGENQDACRMRRPTDDETQKIYIMYCQLATIIHDYAVGQQLYKNSCYSWAITANYYSLMHCGRFICLIISHQIDHSVLKTEFPKVYKEIKKLNEEYLGFVFRLLVAYINSLDYKDYFIAFLKDKNQNYPWAITDLIKNLRCQNINIEIIEGISNKIDEELLNTLIGGS